MKLSGLLLFPLLALAIPAPEAAPAPEALAAPEAAPVPMPEANPRPEPGKLVARANMTCKTTADGVRYRTCASTSCTAVGQYPIGKSVTFTCWKYGECINGDWYDPF
jgi:hypothetical protein